MWKRVIVVIIALGVVGVITAAIVVSNTTSTSGVVQLSAADVHVTKCESDFDGLEVSADVVNPTRMEANLVFGLEWYLGNDDVGFTNMTATRVGGGKHALVSGTTFPNSSGIGELDVMPDHHHLTCDVVNVSSGGAVQPR